MFKEKFYEKIQEFEGKLSFWKVVLNEKKVFPFTYGYFFDTTKQVWVVYEVGERSDFGILAECGSEHEALEELYIAVRYTYRAINGR
ncbi:hypothetical protein BU202_02010 [Streptococcus cuniculi]|uniref:Uncharacterized protein n=1 Tax=Streptococcus cuniculi TaxID=1432788 RepID=A0A1Q8E9E1_9STRE|nr:hypothetical protein [Streptococcus cuniculi]OLF48416.1 hypothetical protein BU202_02010 [Streptococcus cuniculi]